MSLALKGELATASDKICSLDNDVAQLSFALAILSKRFRSLQRGALLVDAVGFAAEVVKTQAAVFSSSPTSSLSLRADSLGSSERSPPPDVRDFSPSPPPGFLDP